MLKVKNDKAQHVSNAFEKFANREQAKKRNIYMYVRPTNIGIVHMRKEECSPLCKS